ncbi:MAG TPA: flagellar hook-length control protein FliK [Acidobacteriaceae bacterium]
MASSAEQGPLGVSGPIQTGAAVAAPPNSEPGSIQPAAADAMQSGAQMARMATDAGAEHHEPFSRSAASGPGNAAQRDLGPQNASAPQAFAQFTQAHQVATSEDAAHHAAAEEHVSSVTPQTAMQHVAELNQARALQGAMRDFRVGVQTESFGRVTVQAVTEGGQLSAQLLLENSKQSAVLAAHLPGLEQRLSQQYGVNASVSLAGGWEHGSGGSTGDGGRNSESSRGAQPEDVPYARARSESSLPEEGTAVPTAMHSRYVSSILDVTV